MRRLPALRGALRHPAPDRADLDHVAGGLDGLGLDAVEVRRHDRAVRPGARHCGEVEASLGGQPTGLWRRQRPSSSPVAVRRRLCGRSSGRRDRHRRLPHAARLGGGLAGGEDLRDGVADRDVRALRRRHGREHAVRRRLDLDRHLVGLDLHQRLALGHLVALRLQPPDQASGLLRDLERGHDHVRRHQRLPTSSSAAATTRSGVGTVWSSSTGENGIGTSIAPSRRTGASRWKKASSATTAASSADAP